MADISFWAPFGPVFFPFFMTTTQPIAVAMPRYRCHKDVWALKIKAILNPNEGLEVDGGRARTDILPAGLRSLGHCGRR